MFLYYRKLYSGRGPNTIQLSSAGAAGKGKCFQMVKSIEANSSSILGVNLTCTNNNLSVLPPLLKNIRGILPVAQAKLNRNQGALLTVVLWKERRTCLRRLSLAHSAKLHL